MSNAATPGKPKQSQRLGDFSPPYFDHVLAEFELLPSDGDIPAKVQRIIEEHESGVRPGWGGLYLLEKYVICKQPKEVLKARLPGLRSSYRAIVGPEAYEQYLQSGQAAPPDSGIDALRADAGRLLDALHWAYAMAPERELTRTGILKDIVWEMLVSGGIGVAVLLYAFDRGQTLVANIVLVTLMGALGGFLSVQQRIAKIPTEQDPILTMFQLQAGRFAVRLAPLTGAICAVVLFLIFQADLLRGGLFPDMTKLSFWLGTAQPPAGGFINQTAGVEYAKLLVWCFIAGFAERLVPDTLNNLISKQEQPETAKVAAVIIPAKAEQAPAESAASHKERAAAAPGTSKQPVVATVPVDQEQQRAAESKDQTGAGSTPKTPTLPIGPTDKAA